MANYEIELYRINVVTAALERIDIISSFENLSFTNKLNEQGSCSFTLDLNHPKATTANLRRYRTVVAVKRNSTYIWVGPIITISGGLRSIGGKVRIQAASYLHYLSKAYTGYDLNFVQIDAGQIAWQLINTVQTRTNGTKMITQGSIQATQLRDRTYDYKRISDAITDLSDVINGFDFKFLPITNVNGLLDHMEFEVSAGYATDRIDLGTLRLGEEIVTCSFGTEGTISNNIQAIGAGVGESILVGDAENTDAQISYTRLEEVYSYKGVSVETTINEKAIQALNTDQAEVYSLDVELNTKIIDPTELNLGDILNLDLETDPASFIDFSQKYRVTEIAVDVDQNGAESLTPRIHAII